MGTPGRILQLVREKELLTKGIKHFILDECDKMLEQLDMRRDVQEIFKATPHEKQVRVYGTASLQAKGAAHGARAQQPLTHTPSLPYTTTHR